MSTILCTHQPSWLSCPFVIYSAVEGLVVVDAFNQLLDGVESLWRDAYDLGDCVRLQQEEVHDGLNLVCIIECNRVSYNVYAVGQRYWHDLMTL